LGRLRFTGTTFLIYSFNVRNLSFPNSGWRKTNQVAS